MFMAPKAGEISLGSTARTMPSSQRRLHAGAEHGWLVELEADAVADVGASALEDVRHAEPLGGRASSAS